MRLRQLHPRGKWAETHNKAARKCPPRLLSALGVLTQSLATECQRRKLFFTHLLLSENTVFMDSRL